jgi:hypothetical protein
MVIQYIYKSISDQETMKRLDPLIFSTPRKGSLAGREFYTGRSRGIIAYIPYLKKLNGRQT